MVAAGDLATIKTVRKDSETFLDLAERLLSEGHRIRFPADGSSMLPTIQDGDTLTVVRVEPGSIAVSDIVLFRAGTRAFVHRVIEVRHTEGRGPVFIARGDGRAEADPPVEAAQILGSVVAIDPQPRWKRLARRIRLAILARTNQLHG
jgi:hypothetical protein